MCYIGVDAVNEKLPTEVQHVKKIANCNVCNDDWNRRWLKRGPPYEGQHKNLSLLNEQTEEIKDQRSNALKGKSANGWNFFKVYPHL